MTQNEQRTIETLNKVIAELRQENKLFRESITLRIEDMNSRLEQKTMPITLEQDVAKAVQVSISKALVEAMTGYNSPLIKYAHNVVAKYQNQLESIFTQAVNEGIGTEEFKARVKEVMLSKIAKTLISGVDGSIDKTINLMKQDAIFRSRLTLSVNGLVDEFLKPKPNDPPQYP